MPLTDEDLNEFLKPEYQTITPAAAVAPQPSAIAGPAGNTSGGVFSPEQQKNLLSVLYNGAVSPNDEARKKSPGSIFSTKPDWYQGGPPPEQNPGLGSLKTLAESAAAGAQRQADLSAKEPLRKFSKKMADQASANQLGVLSGLLGYAADRKQQNYAQELDAAKKQAEMYKTLSGGGARDAQNALGALNYAERVSRNDELATETQRKAQLAKDMRDPESEMSKGRREAMLASGVFTPDQVNGRSAEELDKMRTAAMQTQAQGNRSEEFDRQAQIKQAEEINKANVGQVIKAENEKRDEQRRREQAHVPGGEWAGPPPESKVQEEVRNMVSSSRKIDSSAQKLSEIQDQLNKKGLLVAAGGKYGIIEKAFADPEAKKLIEEARQEQRKLLDAYRQRAQYGVMNSTREQTFAEEVTQSAGSPEGFLIGKPAWDAIRKTNVETLDENTQPRGWYRKGTARPNVPDIQQKPAEETIHRFQAPPQHKRGGAPANIVQDSLSPEATGPEASPAAGAKHTYRVNLPKGGWKEFPLSDEEAVKLLNKLGQDNVKLLQ